MSIKEANRLSIMRQLDKKILTLNKAAEELGVSKRQAIRIRKRYLAEGEKGLITRHQGKISSNRIDFKLRENVIKILRREEYVGFGPTLVKEKLRSRHGYYLSKETLRKWMMEDGLWEGKTQKVRKIYQHRTRRARFGELLQGDGSRHAWFEERGEECTLVIFVDDATSILTAGLFVSAETIDAYQGLLEQHLKRYGRPLGLYVDKHSIFRTTRENSGAKERETHFGRVLREFDIDLICAHSPQAKGRVERANGVLQDRLIKEMRLKKICTIEEANHFLPEFIEDYNERFGKTARDPENAHRPMREGDDLERIFARRTIRKLSKSLSFHYEGTVYQLKPRSPNRFRSTHVTILERMGKPLLIECGGQELPYEKWEESFHGKPQILDSKQLEAYWPKQTRKRPGKHHPWH